MPFDSTEELHLRPISDPDCSLSDSELRETAYEILLAACRSSGARPLTYVSQSEILRQSPTMSRCRAGAPALENKIFEIIGLEISKKSSNSGGNMGGVKKSLSIAELMRVQMGISEQTDSRIRRALLRIAAGQLGRRVESMVLPLEFLQQLKLSDFPNQKYHEIWQRRNLEVLETGLLLYPYVPLDSTPDTAKTVDQLQQITKIASKKPLDSGKSSEMKLLSSAVTFLASRSAHAVAHWADGYPLNFRLYKPLLEALFDPGHPVFLIEEADRVIDLLKKTWPVLGIDNTLHRIFFARVLLSRFREMEPGILTAVGILLDQVVEEAEEWDRPYMAIIESSVGPVLTWADRRLSSYRRFFDRANSELIHGFVSLRISAARVLHGGEGFSENGTGEDAVFRVVDGYIRSSTSTAFAQEVEACAKKKRSGVLPVLSVVAQEVNEVMYEEREVFSPVLRRWHPNPAGVAAATLHSCFGNELRRFVSAVTELTPDVIHVMIAANKLEKDLVAIAVEESAESDDGGKGVVREMEPFEVDTVISGLVHTWIKTRLDRMAAWVDRNLQQEEWNPRANKERVGGSAVEMLRWVEEMVEAFFLLPITIHPSLLPFLLSGLDSSLHSYILKASSSGKKCIYIPATPPATRSARTGPKFGVFKKKERPEPGGAAWRPEPGGAAGEGEEVAGRSILQMCVRINTMNHISKSLAVLESAVVGHLAKAKYPPAPAGESGGNFVRSVAECRAGLCQLSEGAAYKVVFRDLSHVLADRLYADGVNAGSRIGPFLQELDYNLEIISAVVAHRVRTRVLGEMMRASFDGFLWVLMAGGPHRFFGPGDGELVEEDFRFLTDLFWCGGDGLPRDMIQASAAPVIAVLNLFRSDTEVLIAEMRKWDPDGTGSWSAPGWGPWADDDPRTIFRVLCHRQDVRASKFLKKAYGIISYK